LRRRPKILFVVLVIAFIITVSIMLIFYPTFNSENWKEYPNDRSKYVHSLVYSDIIIDKEFEEIISILGNPDITRNNSNSGSWLAHYDQKDCVLEYLTGGTKLIDFERLQVHIQNGTAVKVKVKYD
jgi:hypothetical protein